MAKKLKIGILGLDRGNFALKAAQVLCNDMILSAVCEINKDKIEGTRKYLQDETEIFTDFDKFIHSGLDGVVLCDYFHKHAHFAIEAMKAGVAVLSETTAAPSLGECLDLVEAYEKYNGKYMLAANCIYFKPLNGMIEKINNQDYGKVMYAEAEYIHPSAHNNSAESPKKTKLHWRDTLPTCYYNMHTLGPLMYITKTMPKKVLCKAVQYDDGNHINNTPKTFTLTEMDSGAVFNTTGCVRVGTQSKWYRVACEKGTLETVRYDYRFEPLLAMGFDNADTNISYPDWDWGNLTAEQKTEYKESLSSIGHGGIDFFVMLNFLRYLRGETEIFFDIYRSLSLSAVGILSWYSVLNDSKQYDVPDFRDKDSREKCRGDYQMPFGDTLNDITLACRMDN